ncbi:MAG: hypothetical protein AB7E04_07500 [Desulfobacteraceae bacterium]
MERSGFYAEALYLSGDRLGALESVQRGLLMKCHWNKRLSVLQEKILLGKIIVSHKPFSN